MLGRLTLHATYLAFSFPGLSVSSITLSGCRPPAYASSIPTRANISLRSVVWRCDSIIYSHHNLVERRCRNPVASSLRNLATHQKDFVRVPKIIYRSRLNQGRCGKRTSTPPIPPLSLGVTGSLHGTRPSVIESPSLLSWRLASQFFNTAFDGIL